MLLSKDYCVSWTEVNNSYNIADDILLITMREMMGGLPISSLLSLWRLDVLKFKDFSTENEVVDERQDDYAENETGLVLFLTMMIMILKKEKSWGKDTDY